MSWWSGSRIREELHLWYGMTFHDWVCVWCLVFTIQPSASSPQSLVLDCQFSIVSSQFSVFNSQFPVLSSQYSVLSSQFSILMSQFLSSQFLFSFSHLSFLGSRPAILSLRSLVFFYWYLVFDGQSWYDFHFVVCVGKKMLRGSCRCVLAKFPSIELGLVTALRKARCGYHLEKCRWIEDPGWLLVSVFWFRFLIWFGAFGMVYKEHGVAAVSTFA